MQLLVESRALRARRVRVYHPHVPEVVAGQRAAPLGLLCRRILQCSIHCELQQVAPRVLPVYLFTCAARIYIHLCVCFCVCFCVCGSSGEGEGEGEWEGGGQRCEGEGKG